MSGTCEMLGNMALRRHLVNRVISNLRPWDAAVDRLSKGGNHWFLCFVIQCEVLSCVRLSEIVLNIEGFGFRVDALFLF